jgi:cation diffusion facilitator CzcD-associated flavoprotein CzcO
MPAAPASAAPVLVIGAGPAGLAVAACLQHQGIRCRVFERGSGVGTAWRTHYDRLHLHTPAATSHLPLLPFPAGSPRYPARDQVGAYLEAYRQAFGIVPEFETEVSAARRTSCGWRVVTNHGEESGRRLIVATGLAREPFVPAWPEMGLFGGQVLHSSAYRNGQALRGRRVLVVGFGNSGAEIALDAHEHGADVAMSVRAGIHVVPREILGIPITTIAGLQSWWPPGWADVANAPILALTVGGLAGLGLQRTGAGAMRRIRDEQRVPVIDVGTMRLLREGAIRLHPGIERFTADGVQFVDGSKQPFDTIVLATGYRTGLTRLLEGAAAVLDGRGIPKVSGRETLPGLYFCGFHVTPAGMLREIGREASRIARDIRARAQRPA